MGKKRNTSVFWCGNQKKSGRLEGVSPDGMKRFQMGLKGI
jgi:hypothetical protein